jgi:hypothetical protein
MSCISLYALFEYEYTKNEFLLVTTNNLSFFK